MHRHRHEGLLIVVVVLAASVQDRDGATTTLLRSHAAASRARFIFADGAFVGRLIEWAGHLLSIVIAVVRKPADRLGFAVIPRRWAVERAFAWITAHRRWPGSMNATPMAPGRSGGWVRGRRRH